MTELKEKVKEDIVSRFIQMIGYEDSVMVKRISEAVRYGFDKGTQFINNDKPIKKLQEKELSKGFTGIEINGVRFSNIQEMLIYIEKKEEDLKIAELLNRNINAMNKELESERDKYRNMVFDLQEQIVDLKDYILKVSKFLHNNGNVRPDKLAYKERDMLLIKELKLFEKWELSE